ncbi:long-subunit acyl-CoA synthetase (AMP-forming) [Filimonas zeae]|uniref:Uncharacterized protein n=1 Tax=Filimonas zeae TaxID=1737353 RepID=A0A917MWP5_9BACT|nr:hypothetical protein [Filimonas zeae]MDR6340166.1 long-subunit acyl-CoA synthetase (AMP-forming) [Filimonas zeae]GGH71457.1 hypothetical protein GCM10011379_30820 [Filimonas zeae]
MKYSQTIGIVAALALMGACFLPWIHIPSLQETYTGMYTGATRFGRPGVMTISLAAVSVLLFSIPRIWAKRTNVIIAAIGISWAARNFMLMTSCLMGECPEKKSGIYVAPFLAAVIMLMTLLPKMVLPAQKKD